MRKFKLEITATVVFDYEPSRYPPAMSPQDALNIEMAQAADDPAEYLSMDNVAKQVVGELIVDAMTEAQKAALFATAVETSETEPFDAPGQLARLERESLEMLHALEQIRKQSIPGKQSLAMTLGMIDAYAHMALVRASISRSLKRARSASPVKVLPEQKGVDAQAWATGAGSDSY